MRITTITTGLLAALLLLPASASAITGHYGEYPAPTGNICGGSPIDSSDVRCTDLSKMVLVYEGIAHITDYNRRNVGFWTPLTNTYGTQSGPDCWYAYKSMDLWYQAGSPKSIRDCVYVGTESVSLIFKSWLFNDIPVEDRNKIMARQEVHYSDLRVGGTVMLTSISVSKPYGSGSVDGYCSYFSNGKWLDDRSAPALDRTPDSIMQACKFTRRTSDPVPDVTAPPTPEAETSIVVPGSAARCGSVNGSGSTVAVRSSRHSCKVARSVVNRYARSLRSPAGWSCTAIVNDTSRRAKCVVKRTGRANPSSAVYGIWIRT
jgi:hypothetical protein